MHLSDHEIVAVFDVETTGLSAAYGDRICEVGIVRARGDEIIETYQSLVNPQRSISEGAARVNGLSDEQVRCAPVFGEVAGEVLKRIEGTILVCHNAPFDLSFLDAELRRVGLDRPKVEVLDTLDIARRWYRFRSNSLAAVATNLRITNVQAHRALGDALTTFHVFRTFYRQLAERGVLLDAGPMNQQAAMGRYPAQPSQVSLPPAIQAALTENRSVKIIYLDAQGQRTCRRITPRQALAQGGGVQLVAYCHLRQAERSFRLDRIVAVIENGPGEVD